MTTKYSKLYTHKKCPDSYFYSRANLSEWVTKVIVLNKKTEKDLQNILNKKDFSMRDAVKICKLFSQKREPCATHYIRIEVKDDKTDELIYFDYFRMRYGWMDSVKLRELTGKARLMRIQDGDATIDREFEYDPVVCFQLKENSKPKWPLLYCHKDPNK